jgi:hypothetical protein
MQWYCIAHPTGRKGAVLTFIDRRLVEGLSTAPCTANGRWENRLGHCGDDRHNMLHYVSYNHLDNHPTQPQASQMHNCSPLLDMFVPAVTLHDPDRGRPTHLLIPLPLTELEVNDRYIMVYIESITSRTRLHEMTQIH